MTYQIYPVGVIHNKDDDAWIEIFPEYADALLGIEQFSHIMVLYWFLENDSHEQRSVLQVHPCGNKRNPLTGVFATHSPRRPNLIALSRCRLLAVKENNVTIDTIDAYDGSPVIDIKAFFPDTEPHPEYRHPDWKKDGTS